MRRRAAVNGRRAWNCKEYVIHHPLQRAGDRSRCIDCGLVIIKVDGEHKQLPTWVALYILKEWP